MNNLDLVKHKDIVVTASQWTGGRGPWQWYGNTKMHDVQLATTHSGRVFVMDFARWGLRGGQPRFQVDQMMVTLGELAKREDPLGPRFEVPYRRDFHGIGHPIAAHIAANDPTTVLALIQRIQDLEAALAAAAVELDRAGAPNSGCRSALEQGIVLP
jgi:hypothetical protein